MVVKRLLDGRFQFIRVVSTKSYSKTYLMMDQNDPAKGKCIVKRLQLPTQNPVTLKFLTDLLDKRVKILQRLEDRACLEKRLAVIQDNQDFYWVRGYVPGRPLQVDLAEQRSRPEPELRQFLIDVLSILEIIQQHGIVHQNLHPNNLIRHQTEGHLVLVDFGLVHETTPRTPWTSPGAEVAKPNGNEVYLPQVPPQQAPNFNADHFALGMMALQLATGLSREALPYLEQPDFLDQAKLQLDECSALSDGLKALLLEMLSLNSELHLSRAKDILSRLVAPVPSPDNGLTTGANWASAASLDESVAKLNGGSAQPIPLNAASAAAANGPLPLSTSLNNPLPPPPSLPRSQRRPPAVATVLGAGLALLTLGFFVLQMPKRLSTARLTQQAENAEQVGQIQEAIGYLDQVIQRQPEDSETLAQRSELLLKNGQQEQALDDLTRAIQTDSTAPLLYFQRGNLRSDLGDLQGAIDDYTTALELDPSYSDAYLNRGSARADLGDETGAVDDYTAALEVTDDPEKMAIAYLNRCLSLSNLEDHAAALSDCSAAINLRPSNGYAYGNRGLVKRQLSDYQGAIQDFTIAIQINPDNPEPYYNRGLTRQSLGDLSGAMTDFNQTIKLNPNHPFAYYDRGLLNAALGEVDEAISDLEKVASACLEVGRVGCFDDAQYQLQQLRDTKATSP